MDPGDESPLHAARRETLEEVGVEIRDYPPAIERFRETAKLYEECGDHYEATRVRVNIGANYVAMGKIREGNRLRRALYIAKHRGSACTDEILPYLIYDRGLRIE